MKFNLRKQLSTLAFATSFAAAASVSMAGECRVAEASMDKPGGFPERALTMIVPYGPGGGSGQGASTSSANWVASGAPNPNTATQEFTGETTALNVENITDS